MKDFKNDLQYFFKRIVFACLLLTIVYPSSLQSAYAEDADLGQESELPQSTSEEPAENDVGFTVEPVFTDTQIDQLKGFFFIKVTPGESQDLVVRVKSTNQKPAKVKVYVKDAFTNQNGSIDYDGLEYTVDDTLTDSLEEITTVSDPEVTVQNFQVKDVTVKITPPEEAFQGVKCAAICVMKADEEESEQGLSSTFGYRVGLVVTEDSDTYADGSSLNLLDVQPTVHEGKRVIQARLQNPESKVLENLTVETKLRKKGSKEILRKRTTNDMRMAPNSQFDFATSWRMDPLEAGTYVLSVKASSGSNNWDWEKEFTIGEEEVRKINEEATYTITYPSWVPVVVIGLGIVTIACLGSLYVRRKKWTNS